jgi:hypothetical protein
MKTKLTDFEFKFSGYGIYKVTYTSPTTGKSWTATITDMTIIDDTKNSDTPTQKSLNQLKAICKTY